MFADSQDIETDEETGDGEGEAAGGDGGGMALELGWHYQPEAAEIHHTLLRKRIRLADLDTGLKIIRTLAAIEARPELEIDGLIDALEFAAWDRYGQDLGSVLASHSDGSQIAWPLAQPELYASPQERFSQGM
jgi:hypothetical protein